MTTVNTTGGAKPATILLDGVDGLPYSDTRPLPIRPGSGAADIGKAEDAPHASGDVGVMSLAVRKDTPTPLAGADGDYAPLEVDSAGRQWVRIPGCDATNEVVKVSELRAISPAITASGQLILGVGVLCSVTVSNSHTSNAMTVDFYDNTTGAAPRIGCQRIVPPSKSETFSFFVPFATGIWATFTGGTVAGCDATYRAVL